MKQHPNPKKPLFGAPPKKEALLNKTERNRMIFMGVLLLMVTVAFGASLLKKSKYEQHENDQLGDRLPTEEPIEEIAVRRFDLATIEGDVHDTTPEQRVIIDHEPLAKMLDHTAGYGPGQWKGLQPEELTAEAFAAVLADPDANRAKPFWLRGRLLSYEERPVGERVAWYGTLETEGGTHCTFMTSSFDTGLFGAVDEDLIYARLEGLFLEIYRREGDDGWLETPLLVGSRLTKSYPRLDGFNDADLIRLLAAVQDDTTTSGHGMDEVALLAQWLLMDRVAQGWGDQLNWDGPEVKELNNETFNWLTNPENGDIARGTPIVLPISRNMGSRTENPGENPARLDTITTGWIGNFNWTKKGAVLKFIAPGALPEIAAGDTRQLVRGRGFFLKNLRYQSSQVETRLAPVLVLHSLEVFTPVEDKNVSTVLLFVGGITILLLILIPVLVIRDRKQSEKLHKELVRRKQERRRRTASAGQA